MATFFGKAIAIWFEEVGSELSKVLFWALFVALLKVFLL